MGFTQIKPIHCLFVALLSLTPAHAAEDPEIPLPKSDPARVQKLQADLATTTAQANERIAVIRRELGRISDRLAELQQTSGGRFSPSEQSEVATLTARRSMLQDEQTYLEAAVAARQSALEAEESQLQLDTERALFERQLAASGYVYFSPEEVASLRADIELAQAILGTIEKTEATRGDQLKSITEALSKGDRTADRAVLEAQRNALAAQLDSSRESRQSWRARINLLERKLQVASPATASAMTTQPTTTSSPAIDREEAENKRKIAEVLEREARGEREEAKRRLRVVREQMVSGTSTRRLSDLEDDREYWEHKFDYESRRVMQANAEKRSAMEKRQIAAIETDLLAARKTAEELRKTRGQYSEEERQASAEQYRQKAEECRKRAGEVAKRAQSERPDAIVWEKLVASITALEEALRDRLERTANDFHFSRMRRQLDAERLQVNVFQNTFEVIAFAQLRQSTLLNKLADVYIECAHILVPPEPSFWQKNQHIIESVWIVSIAFGVSYSLKFVIWVLHWLFTAAANRGAKLSVKRIETLLSFFAGIVRLFVWVFALIMVLNQFNIDPAKTTGMLGLVTLVLVGMFQQIVIDFVKGFDILTGRHYNVGDFVELDGKTGHVIDFSVKHTRIRTASGQEYNLPNSKCIPSRRFPDGYVDNYVDVAVKASSDVPRAKRVILPICRNLARRIEQLKEEPIFVDQFPGPRPQSIILRYRVRVLPGSDWVVRDQFIPDVKAALGQEGIELAGEISFFFLNRIQTFRMLFARELSEAEILRDAKEQERPTVERTETEGDSTPQDKNQPINVG